MNTITNTTTLPQNPSPKPQTRPTKPPRNTLSSSSPPGRRASIAALVLTLGLSRAPRESLAEEHHWGTRSFIRERFFEPGLSPEDAVARIKQTAEGLHSIRDMLENEAWRYVLFYVRLKIAYLSQDLKNAISTLPDSRRGDYARAANELIENIGELDEYIRTPRVYESYLYYEKTLKSIDEVVAILQA